MQSPEVVAPLRILSFGHDENLLLSEDDANEGQYRQKRYCELLNQKKTFVILTQHSYLTRNELYSGLIVSTPAHGKKLWSQLLRAFWRGIRLAQLERPHLIEYQDPETSGLVAFLIARRLRLPLVGGIFNDALVNELRWRRSVRSRVYRQFGLFVLRRTTLARCDSRATTAALHNQGHKQVRFVPFFVPWLEKFAVSEDVIERRAARWRGGPLVLCVARLAEEKNIPLLLRAFARVCEAKPKCQLVIVGSGPLEGELKGLGKRLGIDDRLDWHGAVGYDALPSLYREANLFVLPSDSETSARVLILAQAARLPTLTTDTSGSDEIVKDGETGFIVPVGDEEALVSRLQRLLRDEPAYRHMLESPRYSAGADHGEQCIRESLRSFYAEASRPRPRSVKVQ